MTDKIFADWAERNKTPIADVMAEFLPQRGEVLEIASGKHRGFGRFQCTHCMALAVQRCGRSTRNAAGGDRATLNLSKTLCFVGMT